jgi:hypothetical protein
MKRLPRLPEERLPAVLESILFVADEPVDLASLMKAVRQPRGEVDRAPLGAIRAGAASLRAGRSSCCVDAEAGLTSALLGRRASSASRPPRWSRWRLWLTGSR